MDSTKANNVELESLPWEKFSDNETLKIHNFELKSKFCNPNNITLSGDPSICPSEFSAFILLSSNLSLSLSLHVHRR